MRMLVSGTTEERWRPPSCDILGLGCQYHSMGLMPVLQKGKEHNGGDSHRCQGRVATGFPTSSDRVRLSQAQLYWS